MKREQISIALNIIPPAAFLVLIGIFVGVGVGGVFEPPLLLPILTSIFSGALPLCIAFLALRSYAAQGARIFLLLGCGLVGPGLASLFAAWGLLAYGSSYLVTIHNVGSLIGGACHLAAVGMLFLGSPSTAVPSRTRALVVGTSLYSATGLLVAGVAVLAMRGLTPTFFTQDAGPTLLRQAVLTSGAICYALSAVLLVGLHARTGLRFLNLYANALFLTAFGLSALLAQKHPGSLLSWTGRASVYAGSIYFVAAVLVGRRETRRQGSSLPRYLSELFRLHLDDQVLLRTQDLSTVNDRLRQEVAERRMAEENLRRSEERLRLAADATGFGVCAYDFSTRVGYWSPEFLVLFDFAPESVSQIDLDRLMRAIHPHDRGKLLAGVSAAVDPRSLGVLDVDFRSARADGAVRWLKVRGRTVFTDAGPSGRPRSFSGIVQDITERKLAEAQLLDREETYRSIIENSLQGIAIIHDGRIVLCNEALCRMNGYTKEETYRMTQEEVMATIHPLDRARVSETMQTLADYEAAAAAPQVIRLLDKSGNVRWVEVLGGRTLYGGQPALQISYLDVTDKRRAEDAYRTLVENSIDGYAILRDGRVVFANTAFARISGYRVEEIRSMTTEEISAMVHPDDRRRLPGSRDIEDGDGSPAPVVRFRLLHRDGSWRMVEAQSIAVEYEGAPAVQVAYRDVTEARAAQDALDETHRKMRNLASHLLRAREDERRKVAQEVHDELGQILAALKMDLHWLKKRVQGTSEAVDRKMKGMIELGEQTIGVVQRISSELRPKMLDDLGLAPALDWLAADFRRRIRVACSVNVDVPSGMIGGKAATILYRVVQEALSNVGRHSLARHARIDLCLSDGSIELQVEDDGIGITPTQRSAADSYGLIGMHERIEGLGGTVSVTGEPGRGTTVTARIPLPPEGGLA